MSNLDPHTGGQGSWLGAVVNGVAVCLLLGAMLMITVRVCWPQVADGSTVANLVAATVWLVSIGVGVWQTLRHRRGSGQ